MKPRAADTLPVTLLLLLLAAFVSGCTAGPPASAAGNEGDSFSSSGSNVEHGIPVTGFGLEVAGCDPRGTFLNFRLSDSLVQDTAAKIAVEFDGRPARCQHPLGDASLLSCTIPPLAMFPVIVVVKMDEAVIAQFSYDGASCPVPIYGQAAQEGVPLAPTSSATAAALATLASRGGLPPTAGILSQTLTPLPAWTGQPTPTTQPAASTEPPATQPPATQPPPTQPPATQPPPTQPPPTQPPPTQPPATEPPPTSGPQPTTGPRPSPTQKPPPTPRPSPTQKPPPTPKPTHTSAPPPTQPPATEPPPTPSGYDLYARGPRLAWSLGQGVVAA